MKWDEAKQKAKEAFWKLQDKWDEFAADKFRTHMACVLVGMAIGFLVGHRW